METIVPITDPAFRKLLERAARRDKLEVSAWVLRATRKALGLDGDLTIGEVAQRLNCHKNTVRNYIKDGRLSAYQHTDRTIRVTLASVDALKERTV